MAQAEKNIAGFWRGGRFHPIRSGTIWPSAEPGKRRPDPRQSELDYNEFKTNDLTRTRKMTEVDMTLSQLVRSMGGIKPDRSGANEGEWRRLTYKESGVRGLAHPGGKVLAEAAAHHARELGFRVPSDPNAFLWALEADAAGQKVIRHPEWYEHEAERLYMARNGLFTAEEESRARRVSTANFRAGSQVRIKGTKKTAFIKSPLRDRQKGVVAYVLSTGGVVSADDVEFINPPRATSTQQRYAAELAAAWGRRELTPAHRARVEAAGRAAGLTLRQVRAQISRAQKAERNGSLSDLLSKVSAGREVRKAYRKEISIRNDIKRATREEEEATDKAEKATGRVQQRLWERRAASAYKRRVKLEAQLAKASVRRESAATRATTVYANGRRSAANVTPQMAQTMLRANVGNRPVDHAKVAAMAELMRRGIYKRTKPLVFTNDVLTDGQHTLLAIVKSGATVPLKVEHKTLSPAARRHAPNAPTRRGVGASEKNPLGDVGMQAVSGFAAGAAGAVAGAMLAPLIERYIKGRKEKKAALEAVTQNPARPDAHTAGLLASVGRSRLMLAARELGQAARPGRTAAQEREHKRRAAHYQQQGAELLQRAARAYPVVGNPIRLTPRAVEQLHREFRGFPTSGHVTPYHTPPGSPPDAPYLGELHRIILQNGRELMFDNNPAALLATTSGRRRLLIGLSASYKTPNGADPSQALNYGEVVEVQYITPKPHLYGTNEEKLFFHELGEEGGKCPELILQNGRLSLRGGSYTIKREGIRN